MKKIKLLFILLLSLTIVCLVACSKESVEAPPPQQSEEVTSPEAPSVTPDTTAESFTLTYSSDNAVGGSVSAKSADGSTVNSGGSLPDGTSVTLTATPSKGYSFLGWFDGQTSVSADASYTFSISKSTTLTAKFSINSYTLNFSAYQGFGEVTALGDIQSGAALEFGTQITLKATPNEGYDFEAWYENSAPIDGATDETFSFSMSDSDRTLEARFKPEKRTVTFMNGFEEVNVETVDYNTTAHSFNASLANYSLLGWFTSTDANAQKFDFNTPITQSIILYAKWKEEVVIHEVEFVYEDGRQITLQHIADGNALQLSSYENRVGYTFDKWVCYDDTLEDYVEVHDGDTVTDDMTVIAVYKVQEFTVSFYKNKGDSEPYHTADIPYGSLLSTPTSPTDSDYIFNTWVDENNTEFDFTTPITEAISLYGAWEQKTADTFNVDFYREKSEIDGTSYTDRKLAESGKTVSLPTAPVKDGHSFIGWFYTDGEEKSFTAQTAITANINVYAKYEIKTFNVKFVDYDGRVIKAEQPVNWKESAVAPLDPEREGYTFDGWDISYTSVTEDLTVTATWKIITLQVKYFDGEIQQGSTVNADYGSTLAVPPTPEKAGYSFIGWYTDKSLTQKFDFAKTAVTGNLNIYARFEIIELSKYTVTFKLPDGSTVSEQTVVEGNSAIAPGNPKVTGYTFLNWDKSFDSITANTVITAVMEKTKYTVRFFDYNGNQIGTDYQIEHGELATAPNTASIPCPPNEQFAGWDKNIASYPITQSTDFYAQYALETRTVTFYVYGDIYSQQAVEYDSRANIPNTPARVGYVFIYWYLEDENTPYDFSTPIKENTELHAKFNELGVDIVTVTFMDPQNEHQVGKKQFVKVGGYAMQPAPYTDGTQTAYKWCLAGSETAFDFNTPITQNTVLIATANQT